MGIKSLAYIWAGGGVHIPEFEYLLQNWWTCIRAATLFSLDEARL